MDTGYAGFNHRDPDRIAAAAKVAGVKKIDYLLISHYHADHVGGLYDVAQKFPIRNFIDHGANTEDDKDSRVRFNMYSSFADKANRMVAKPGETIPIKGLEGPRRQRRYAHGAARGRGPAESGVRCLPARSR